jgi:hypothetical protein
VCVLITTRDGDSRAFIWIAFRYFLRYPGAGVPTGIMVRDCYGELYALTEEMRNCRVYGSARGV